MGRYCDILYREKIMAASFAAFVVFAIAASLNIVSSQEPAKCAIFNSCSSCLVFKECGWCASTGLCMTGSNLGPSGGNCTVWDFGICSGEPCSSYGNCYSCSQDPFCGWGQDTFSCMSGTPMGPTGGTCSWEAYNYNTCSLPGPMDAGLTAYSNTRFSSV